MKNILSSHLMVLESLFLILLLLMLEYQRGGYQDKLLEIIVQLFGAFLATFLGVYVSLYYTRKNEYQKEIKENNKVLLGSLKLLWLEIAINQEIVNDIVNALKEMPRIVPNLYLQYRFLIKLSKGIRMNSFYGVIASGGMNEISKNDVLFNALQQIYYNQEIAIIGLVMTSDICKDFKGEKNRNISIQEKNNLLGIIDQQIEKFKITLSIVDKNKNIIENYLSEKNINFVKKPVCKLNSV